MFLAIRRWRPSRPAGPAQPSPGPRLRLRPRRRPPVRRRRSPRLLSHRLWVRRRRRQRPRLGPSPRPLACRLPVPGSRRPAGGRRPSPRSLAGRWSVRALAVLAVAAVVLALAVPPPAAGQAPGGPSAIVHVPPVEAPVVDPFRAPAHPFGPGNRGLEYDTEPGTPVEASAEGTVVFVGQVGGALHVTIRHADGVRTSYSFLSRLDVVRGQTVEQGATVGAAGDRLHFGARVGDAYFDPALLFGSGVTEVELVPFEIPPGSSPEAEIRALREIAFDGGLGLPSPGDAADWLRTRVATASHYLNELSPRDIVTDVVFELGQRVFFPGPCSDDPPPSAPARGQRRVAITVAGLGSSGDQGSIDELRTADLGYADDRVVRFSYAGGKVPGTGGAVAVPALAYESADTQGDLRMAGGRLADLVEDVLAAEPDATVDVLAHSQGGVVARLALLELADRDVDLGRLGLVATLGSPHGGADLATAVAGANTHPTANAALDALEAEMGTGIDPDATAVAQLAESSELIADLQRQGVPSGVDLVSISARGDWVVAAPSTVVDGATNVTVPVHGTAAHGDLVASDAATDELARALAGQPPACESVPDVLGDVLVGQGVSVTEDAGGAAVQALAP